MSVQLAASPLRSICLTAQFQRYMPWTEVVVEQHKTMMVVASRSPTIFCVVFLSLREHSSRLHALWYSGLRGSGYELVGQVERAFILIETPPTVGLP